MIVVGVQLDDPAEEAGAWTPLTLDGRTVGAVVVEETTASIQLLKESALENLIALTLVVCLAVFGALLALEDERVNERLTALRLVLSALEIEAVGRAVGPQPGPIALEFLRDWLELAAEGPLQQERLALRAIVDGEIRAQAA